MTITETPVVTVDGDEFVVVYDDKNLYDWSMANSYCMAVHGTTLASIHNNKSMNIIASVLTTSRTWLGGTDSAIEDVWVWNDGSNWDFDFDWGSGEPDNYGNEDCLEYWNGVWRDDNCVSIHNEFTCNAHTNTSKIFYC